MRKHVFVLAFAFVALASPRASAEDSSASYAPQIAAMDGSAVLLGALFQNPIAFAGAYALGAPIIHWAHRNAAEGFESLALRIVVPVVGAFALRAAAHDDDAAAWGAVGGALFVTTFDMAVLARAPQRTFVNIAGTF